MMRAREFFDPFSPCSRRFVLCRGRRFYVGWSCGNPVWTSDVGKAQRFTVDEALWACNLCLTYARLRIRELA